MKLKALLLACAVAGAGASFALADDGHGKHHDSTTGTSTTSSTPTNHEHSGTTTGTSTTSTTSTNHEGTTTTSDCPRFELKGTIVTISPTSLTLNVTKANEAGQALVGHPATVGVDPKTRVEWAGTGTLTGPNTGDTVKVHASQCAGATTLTAKSVSARTPHLDGSDSNKH